MASWITVKLNEVCEIQRGGSPRPIEDFITEADDGINWIKIGDVAKGAKYITGTKEKIRPEGAKRSREVMHGDFLLSNSMSFGRPYILRTSGCIHDGWLVLRYDKDKLEEDYLYHVLGSEFVYAQFVKFAVGAVVKNLNSEVVRHVSIPLPPLPEQRRIAAILDQADALRAKRREALAQLDSLSQSIFLDMFGDPRINDRNWPMLSVGDVTNCIVPGRDKPKSFSGSTPWVTTSDLVHLGTTMGSTKSIGLTDDEIYAVNARVIPQGSVVMSCVGDLGIISIAGRPMVVNQQLHSFQCGKEVDSDCLMYCLAFQKNFMVAMASSTTLPYMNKSVCNSIPIVVPPLALQQTFSTRIQAVESLKATHRAALIESDALFSSLLHRAFAGQLL